MESNITATCDWLSAEAHYDWFPFSHFARSLHLSPGLIAYNDNHMNATASVAGGNNFTLNGVSYESNPANPVTGTGKLSFNKVAPTFLFGFGNLVPRNRKHFSVNIEAGVAFQGSPKIGLNLAGSACAPGTDTCSNVATNPTDPEQHSGRADDNQQRLEPLQILPTHLFDHRLPPLKQA